jgi:hypothetical protein
VIRIHPEHLLPALAAGIFQVQLDVGKCLVDLCVDFSVNNSSLGIPATYKRVSSMFCQSSNVGGVDCVP